MLTETGVAAGTVAYMSPEQARGEELDGSTDLFSLGVVLYEMSCGRRPFAGATTAALFDAILHREPEPLSSLRPDLPKDLQQVCEQWLRKDRHQRTHSELAPPLPEKKRVASPWLMRLAAGVVVLGIAGAAYVRWNAVPPIHSIAVRPFTGQGPDSEFAAGLSEAFSEDLRRIQDLRVIPHADSGQDADAALSGHFEDGSPMKLHAELNLRDGSRLWERDYSFDRAGLYQTERLVAEDVRAAIGLTAVRVARPGHEPKSNEAYDLYLRARAHTSSISEAELDKAIVLLERAATLDPQFEQVQGFLAYAYGSKAFSYKPNDAELEEKGLAAVQRAFAIDPDAPEAHYGQAEMLWRPSRGFPHREALTSLRRSLAQQPDNDEAWHLHALILSHVGHVEKSLGDLKEALRVNPANTMARARRGAFLIYQQRFQESLDQLNQVPREIFPNWPYQRTWALLSMGRLEEAREEIDRTMAMKRPDQGGIMLSARAMLRALTRDRRGAEADIVEAVRVGEGFGHFHHTAYSIGAVYSVLGDVQKAQQWIERASNTGFPSFSFFEADPFLATARKSEAFRTFLQKLRAEWENIPGEQ
jgi:non-specific serine/threonine protein kinase